MKEIPFGLALGNFILEHLQLEKGRTFCVFVDDDRLFIAQLNKTNSTAIRELLTEEGDMRDAKELWVLK